MAVLRGSVKNMDNEAAKNEHDCDGSDEPLAYHINGTALIKLIPISTPSNIF